MTSTQHDLIIRPVADRDELGLFCRFPYLLNEELADDLEQGRRRLDWLWMALRGSELLARAAWWKRTEGTGPLLREAMAQVVPPGTPASRVRPFGPRGLARPSG